MPSHTVHGVLKARPRLVSTLHHDPSILGGPTQQRSTSKAVGGGAAAAQCPSSCEEIPHTHGQRRNPSETVGGAKSRFESYPIPPRDAQRLKPSLCAPGPRDPTEMETELCLSVPWGGTGLRGLPQGQGLWVPQTGVWQKPPQRRSPLTPPQSCQNLPGLGNRLLEAQTGPCAPGPRRKEQ